MKFKNHHRFMIFKIRWQKDESVSSMSLIECLRNCPWPQRVVGFPGGSAGKESAYNAGDLGSIPGLGRTPEEVKG